MNQENEQSPSSPPYPIGLLFIQRKEPRGGMGRDVQGEEGKGSLPTLSSVLRDKESSPQQ